MDRPQGRHDSLLKGYDRGDTAIATQDQRPLVSGSKAHDSVKPDLEGRGFDHRPGMESRGDDVLRQAGIGTERTEGKVQQTRRTRLAAQTVPTSKRSREFREPRCGDVIRDDSEEEAVRKRSRREPSLHWRQRCEIEFELQWRPHIAPHSHSIVPGGFEVTS